MLSDEHDAFDKRMVEFPRNRQDHAPRAERRRLHRESPLIIHPILGSSAGMANGSTLPCPARQSVVQWGR
eukprot:3432366-Prymnesium_polylepis.1